MSFLKTLSFSDTLDLKQSPITRRRARLVANLRNQLIRLDDPLHSKMHKGWLKVNGEKRTVEKRVAVRPWWRETLDGRIAFFVRSGLRRIEFEKGKSAIVVSNEKELPALINGLIEATERGELDELILTKDQQNKARGIPTLIRKKSGQ